jgi:hypothetical protein
LKSPESVDAHGEIIAELWFETGLGRKYLEDLRVAYAMKFNDKKKNLNCFLLASVNN